MYLVYTFMMSTFLDTTMRGHLRIRYKPLEWFQEHDESPREQSDMAIQEQLRKRDSIKDSKSQVVVQFYLIERKTFDNWPHLVYVNCRTSV